MTLREELQKALNNWLDSSTKNSLLKLAEKTRIGSSTLYRLANGQANPTFETTFPIVHFILDPASRDSFIKKFFPNIWDWKTSHASHTNPDRLDDFTVNEILSSRVGFLVFSLACTHNGTTVDQIRRVAGEVGILELNRMLDLGIVESIDNRFKTSFSQYTTSDIRSNLEQIRHCISIWKSEFVKKGVGGLQTQTESLNLEAIRLIKDKVKSLIYDIDEIASQNQNRGEIPFFCNILYGIFDLESLREEQ